MTTNVLLMKMKNEWIEYIERLAKIHKHKTVNNQENFKSHITH